MALKPISLANLTRAINKLKDYFVQIKDAVKSVNGNEPDATGDIQIDRVDWATDLESSSTQSSRDTFLIRTTGGGASISDGSAWLLNVHGNSVKVGQVDEVLDMTVEAIPRQEGDPITAAINASAFWEAVASGADSGTLVMTYTTVWSTNPATLGVTVTGTPIAGDQIVIVYVKGNRGTIYNANPSALVSTGWNLYDNTAGYARVVRYSDDNGYRIDGAYTAVKFSETVDGEQHDLTITSGLFQIPDGYDSGYVWVTGGNASTTAIYPTHGDWTEGYPGSYQAFTSTSISLSSVMSSLFPYGLMSVGATYDEINLNIGSAVSRIDRMDYNSTNLEEIIASGQEYDTDTNYIYFVKVVPDQYSVTIAGAYSASDHGLEWFEGTSVPTYAQTIYGASLKNKLERDVLTISQQTLSANEKAQVRTNIDAANGTFVSERIGSSNGITWLKAWDDNYDYRLQINDDRNVYVIKKPKSSSSSWSVAYSFIKKYKVNDTYSGKSSTPYTVPGIVTGGQMDLYFTISVPYSLEDITTISFTGSLNGSFRGVGGYLPSNQNANMDLRTIEGVTWSFEKLNNFNISLNFHFTSAMSVTNNSPVMLTFNSFTLKFT